MTRVTSGPRTKQRHKKVLELAKGYRMARHKQYTTAKPAVLHAGEYAFMGRKLRKRDFRTLWIVRLNAGLRELGTTYSTFMAKLRTQNVELDRKVLSYFATQKPGIFKKIVENTTSSK